MVVGMRELSSGGHTLIYCYDVGVIGCPGAARRQQRVAAATDVGASATATSVRTNYSEY